LKSRDHGNKKRDERKKRNGRKCKQEIGEEEICSGSTFPQDGIG
jgi:hypothetical protein